MKKLLAGFVSAITATLCCLPSKAASHATPLFHAASEYQQAAHELGHYVIRSSFLNPYQHRVVRRLMESSDRLLAASRNPESRDRFFNEWLEAQLRFQQVRVVILGDPACPLTSPFAACADRFSCSHQTLAEQVSLTPCLHPLPHWVDLRQSRSMLWQDPNQSGDSIRNRGMIPAGIPAGRGLEPGSYRFTELNPFGGRTAQSLDRVATTTWPATAAGRSRQITRDPNSHGFLLTPTDFTPRIGPPSRDSHLPSVVLSPRNSRSPDKVSSHQRSPSQWQLERTRPDWSNSTRPHRSAGADQHRPRRLGAALQRIDR